MCDGPGPHSLNLTCYTTNVPGGRLAWLSLYSHGFPDYPMLRVLFE